MLENNPVSKSLPKIYGMSSCSEAADNVFAPSLFLFGCNLRCPYCMNSKLVVSKPDVDDVDEIPFDEVKRRLEEDDSEWVMVSGGEPVMSDTEKLIDLLLEIESLGKKRGISTNGTFPNRLADILPYVNYVTMDLKTCYEEGYKEIHMLEDALYVLESIQQSQGELRHDKSFRNDFDYEYRTTLYPGMVTLATLNGILGTFSIQRDEKWVLQQFRHAQNMLDPKEAKKFSPYKPKEIEVFLDFARKYVDNVSLRYV